MDARPRVSICRFIARYHWHAPEWGWPNAGYSTSGWITGRDWNLDSRCGIFVWLPSCAFDTVGSEHYHAIHEAIAGGPILLVGCVWYDWAFRYIAESLMAGIFASYPHEPKEWVGIGSK